MTYAFLFNGGMPLLVPQASVSLRWDQRRIERAPSSWHFWRPPRRRSATL